MISGGAMGGAPSALRFSSTRGRINGGFGQGVNYPSPFFDVAQTWLPTTVKAMFRYCRYYFLTNPLINATVFKMSEYPVTDIVIEHENPEVVKRWTDFLQDTLRWRGFQIEAGLDYHTMGNSLISMSCPFIKYLKCRACGAQDRASILRPHYKFSGHAFRLTCPRCHGTHDAIVRDQYIKSASGIRMMRWNPEDVEITYNDITGNYTYFYNIPHQIKNDITIGRKDIVEEIPQLFIQSLKESKSIVFSKDALFHLRRPTLAAQDRGWGIPMLLPVLKDTFYLQIMKKAQEAILLEHIVPLRVLFPQAGSGSSDPYTSINLADWRDHVAQEIARWRMDQNYIPIMPLPLGNQTIGGDGRALLLSGEIQAWSEQIMVGLGVPREFLMGGMSYSGTNVSMRMLENAFLRYIQRQKQLLEWTIQQIAAYMDWPMVKVRFKPFKMADDIQRKAYLFQLNQAQKISDRTLLADSDLSVEEENSSMIQEVEGRLEAVKKNQLAMAAVQGEAGVIMAKYQAKGQQEMQKAMMAPAAPGEPGGPEQQQPGGSPGGQTAAMGQAVAGGGGGQPNPMAAAQSPVNSSQEMQQPQIDLPSYALMQAQMLSQMDPASQQVAIMNLRAQSPELADLVLQYLAQFKGNDGTGQGGPNQGGGGMPGANGAAAAQVDMRPQPEQKPARRAASSV
jgi:hypothetical protein